MVPLVQMFATVPPDSDLYRPTPRGKAAYTGIANIAGRAWNRMLHERCLVEHERWNHIMRG
eukprot:3291864-Heterocapsa_arctica.AAC.1